MTLALLSKNTTKLPIVNARVACHLSVSTIPACHLLTVCPCMYSFSYCINAKNSLLTACSKDVTVCSKDVTLSCLYY